MILTEIKYARTINTNTHTNDESVHVADIIGRDGDSDEGSNYNMEDSYFLYMMKILPVFAWKKTRGTS